MSDFVFELARSTDMLKLGELTQARNRSLQLLLNRAGQFSFDLPLTNNMALLVQEASTCVTIKRKVSGANPTIIWSGPVWTAEEQTPDTLTVGCVGWLQTLDKRITKPAWNSGQALQYSAVDASAIAFDLLTRSNADNTINTATNYIGIGTSQITQPRTTSYQPFSSVLDSITGLSDLESGFDLYVDPTTRLMNTYTKLQTVQSQVLFDYANNVPNASRASDSSKMCNRFIAYSPTGYAVAEDQVSMAAYGTFEESLSLSDVTNIAILQAYANGEIAIRSTPLRLASFVPRQYSSARPSDPRIFRDFNVGDIVYLNVRKGRFQVPRQAIRVFGATVSFPEVGFEKITAIQTTASGS